MAEAVHAACRREHSRPVCGTFTGAVFDDSARLRLLHQLGCAFASRTELEDLCRLVISKCGEALQAEGVGILLLDPGTQELFFPYVANEDPVAAERLRGLRFPADRGIAGEVMRCARPIRVDDVHADRRFYSGVDEQSGARTRNLIATPLRTEQGVIGVLQAVNRRGLTGFSNDDLAFLEALSGSVAVAIDNARAMEERAALRALRREIEIASEIQQSILPRRFPAFPERTDFDLHAAMLPAHDVGGDFYDFFLIDSTHRRGHRRRLREGHAGGHLHGRQPYLAEGHGAQRHRSCRVSAAGEPIASRGERFGDVRRVDTGSSICTAGASRSVTAGTTRRS